MFHKFWLLSAMALAGCVTESKRDSVVFTMPPVTSATDQSAAADDPLGLQAAIALVRQQPWCDRRPAMRSR